MAEDSCPQAMRDNLEAADPSDGELENQMPQHRAVTWRAESTGSVRCRTGDQIERKRLSDRRSQKLIRERNKLQFQTMKAKLESLEASDSNAEIKRLLAENENLRQQNRKLSESLDAVVALLLPLHRCNTDSGPGNDAEISENSRVCTADQTSSSNGDPVEDRPDAVLCATGRFETRPAAGTLLNNASCEFTTGAILCDTNSSASNYRQHEVISLREAPELFSAPQAACLSLPTIGGSSLDTPGARSVLQNQPQMWLEEEEAEDLPQLTQESNLSEMLVDIAASDQSISPEDLCLFPRLSERGQEMLTRSTFTEGPYEIFPSISPLEYFNNMCSPLELARKTCLAMISSPRNLPMWHSSYWFNGWVIKAIELHRSRSREELENCLPKNPCLCALFQPWQCHRSLAKRIAAITLKSLPRGGLAEKIAIYMMLHALFRVGHHDLEIVLAALLLTFAILGLVIQLFIDPSPENLELLPDFFHPVQEQAAVPHPVWVDFVAWPEMRTKLVYSYAGYDFGEVGAAIASFYTINWSEGDGDILTVENGEVRVTNAFKAHCWRQENWTLKSGWQACFPDLSA